MPGRDRKTAGYGGKSPADVGWKLDIALKAGAKHFAWLKVRKGKITGSKISDIMGAGYNDVYDRYRIERGEMETDGSALAIRRGQLMEPEILKIAEADPFRPGYFETLYTPRFVTMTEEPWIGCSPDFLALSSSPIFCEEHNAWPVRIFGEIKSRDSRAGVYYSDGEAKESDLFQVRWGCMITDAHIGLLVVHLGSASEPIYRIVKRDPAVETEMMAAAQTFRHAVATGDLGLLSDLATSAETRKEIARQRWADTSPDILDTDDPAAADLIGYHQSLKDSRRQADEAIADCEAKIASIMGPHEVMRAGRWRVKLPGKQKGRRTFSRKMLASALPHIDLDQFYKDSPAAPRGRMSIREVLDDE